MGFDGRWAPYVPVAKRRAQAAKQANSLAKGGKKLRPIRIPGTKIATSFWGVAWCNNLEAYADWANRMPRGRTYARNGSILDLQVSSGRINSMVSGSRLYKIEITIEKIKANSWQAIRRDCAANIGSLIDLMRGKLPATVLKRLTDSKEGIFPAPKEITIRCSCPDSARMCKHAAATLYGVGHLLDTEPELFFLMRGVNQSELVTDALQAQKQDDAIGLNAQSTLDSDDLGSIFGIDLVPSSDSISSTASSSAKPKSTKRVVSKKATARQSDSKQAVSKQAISKQRVSQQAIPTRATAGKKGVKNAVISKAETMSEPPIRIVGKAKNKAKKMVSSGVTELASDNGAAASLLAGKTSAAASKTRTPSVKATQKNVESRSVLNTPTKKQSVTKSTKVRTLKTKK